MEQRRTEVGEGLVGCFEDFRIYAEIEGKSMRLGQRLKDATYI